MKGNKANWLGGMEAMAFVASWKYQALRLDSYQLCFMVPIFQSNFSFFFQFFFKIILFQYEIP